jgi:RNA polymerase sigma factor (sigma-70 family)
MPPSHTDGPEAPTNQAAFTKTSWTVVVEAGDSKNPGFTQALETLCRTYWYPLYAYLRRRGFNPDDAQDLVQSFFLRVLEKGVLGHADQARGRFRTFLLKSLENFVANEWQRSKAQKRGGGKQLISWDEMDAESRYQHEPGENFEPEVLFDKRWASTLLAKVLGRLRGEFEVSGRKALFQELRRHIWGQDTSTTYAELAVKLNMTTGAVHVTLHRLRQRYRELLRSEIADTVESSAEVDDEIRHLVAVMSH